jgi:phosphoglycerate kinase
MRGPDQFNFNGRKALVRVDFNVPLDKDLHITDDTRIRSALPTIQKILADGGSVILMSHLGRPKGREDHLSLKHLVPHLSMLTGKNVKFAPDCIGPEAEQLCAALLPGEIAILENLRFHKEEEAGDGSFAQALSKLGDVYVNDAFGTAHRAHASTAVMARYFHDNKLFGYLMEKEVESINKVLNGGEKPVTAIIGGAKVSSKITIIENMLGKVDHLIIGGGMAYTFIKAQGGRVGASLVEDDKTDLALSLLEKAVQMGVKLHLPTDTVIASRFAEDAEVDVCHIKLIPDGWLGLDIGPETMKAYEEVIMNSKTILWNGPMGVFEMEKFANGTIHIAQALAKATRNGAFTLVGGGDSVAAINKFNLAEEVSFVSTGGGAMLESLEGIVLPGIQAVLEES